MLHNSKFWDRLTQTGEKATAIKNVTEKQNVTASQNITERQNTTATQNVTEKSKIKEYTLEELQNIMVKMGQHTLPIKIRSITFQIVTCGKMVVTKGAMLEPISLEKWTKHLTRIEY